jgi:hypothetical protein
MRPTGDGGPARHAWHRALLLGLGERRSGSRESPAISHAGSTLEVLERHHRHQRFPSTGQEKTFFAIDRTLDQVGKLVAGLHGRQPLKRFAF